MDIRSIYEVLTALLGCLFVYIYLIRLSTPNLRGVGWASLGYASAACGALLVSLRGSLPDVLSIPVANALLAAAHVGVYWGIAELLYAARRRRWLLPASVLPILLVQGYFTFAHPLLAPRIDIQSAVVALDCVLLIGLVLRNGSPRTKLPRCALASVFAVWLGFQMVRVYMTIHRMRLSHLPLEQNIRPTLVLVPILVAILSGLCFIWLAMTQLQHELELLSETDALTGLMNRRALERSAAREIAIARRRCVPLALIMMDLDHFKALNDNHGHAAGDVALVSTARCIASVLREVDLLARFGGEEFIALLPDTSYTEALHVAERLRTELETMTIHYRREEIRLAASFGVTILMRNDICLDEVLERCDIALYQAKHNGRNQVVAI